jgi:hypothetical protein
MAAKPAHILPSRFITQFSRLAKPGIPGGSVWMGRDDTFWSRSTTATCVGGCDTGSRSLVRGSRLSRATLAADEGHPRRREASLKSVAAKGKTQQ